MSKENAEFVMYSEFSLDAFANEVLEENNKLRDKLNSGYECFIVEKSEDICILDKKPISIAYKISKDIVGVDYKVTIEKRDNVIYVKANPMELQIAKKAWVKLFLESDLKIKEKLFLLDFIEIIAEIKTFSPFIKDYINSVDYKKIIMDKIDFS